MMMMIVIRNNTRRRNNIFSAIFVYIIVLIIVIVIHNSGTGRSGIGAVVNAWKQCTQENGGGVCPDGNTCCSTKSSDDKNNNLGNIVVSSTSTCIPNRSKDPEDSGQCCDSTGITGCSFGYMCDDIIIQRDNGSSSSTSSSTSGLEKVKVTTLLPVCKLIDPINHPKYLNAPVTPRYQLCQVSSSSSMNDDDSLKLHGFPIASITIDNENENDVYNATYYSNMGNIIIPTIIPEEEDKEEEFDKFNNNNNKFNSIKTILIVVHGSGRNADEYLCTIMSLLDEKNDNKGKGSVLVIAPKFPVEIDLNNNNTNNEDNNNEDSNNEDSNSNPNPNPNSNPNPNPNPNSKLIKPSIDDIENVLYWSDYGPIGSKGSRHTWRYGTEAENNNKTSGISSYDIMDKLIEYIITAKKKQQQHGDGDDDYLFPNLNKISVMGHSAGGQYVQRWSLLSSSSIIFDDTNIDETRSTTTTSSSSRGIEIRTIVANPRSYCYLDNRRMIKKKSKSNNNNDDTYKFDVPSQNDINKCPSYNMWEWGLESGGQLTSPYRDRALNAKTPKDIAIRYGTRRQVYYIIGSNDTIDLNNDNCETYNSNFQGYTRNERGHHYWKSITNYFISTVAASSKKQKHPPKLIHRFYEILLSPHDHTIMFQSKEGREAIFGNNDNNDTGGEEEEEAHVLIFPLSFLLLLLLIIVVHRNRSRNHRVGVGDGAGIGIGIGVVYDPAVNDDDDDDDDDDWSTSSRDYNDGDGDSDSDEMDDEDEK